MGIATKSRQVENFIRRKIQSGRWAPGYRLPAEQDILDELGVSRTTLRDALNSLAKEGLIERRQRAGTFVLPPSKASHIAILGHLVELSSEMGYYFKRLVGELRTHITDAGYRPVLGIGQGDTIDDFISSVHLLDEPAINDTIAVISTVGLGSMTRQLQDAGIYYVAIENPVPPVPNCVILDYENLAHRATKMLLQAGHTDFAIMYTDPPERDNASAARKNRILGWIRHAGADIPDSRLLPVPWKNDSRSSAYDIFKQFAQTQDMPRAILFMDDIVCNFATRAILELGIRVPADLEIITQSNAGNPVQFPVSLTRLEFDAAVVADRAWQMLQTAMSSGEYPQPCEYITPRLMSGMSLRVEEPDT